MSETVRESRSATPAQNEQETARRTPDRRSEEDSRQGAITLRLDDDTVIVMMPETGVLRGGTIHFEQVEVPEFKVSGHRKKKYEGSLARNKGFTPESRQNTRHRDVWKRDVGEDTKTVQTALRAKYVADYGTVDEGGNFVFKAPSKYSKSQPVYFIGDLATIARELTLPTWDKDGEPHDFHVDHILELQLAYWPRDNRGNKVENMELLDASVNMSSGSVIKNSINALVNAFIETTRGHFGQDPEAIKRTYDLRFGKAVGVSRGKQPRNIDFWKADDIEKGLHLAAVEPANLADLGGDGYVRILPRLVGKQAKRFSLRGAEGTETAPVKRDGEHLWLRPFEIKKKVFYTEGEDATSSNRLGLFTVNIDPGSATKKRRFKPLPSDEVIEIRRVEGARYVGVVDERSVRSVMDKVEVEYFSPIRIDTFDITADEGIVVSGAILPQIPLLAGTDLGFELRGSDLSVYKVLTPEELWVPSPFVVRDSSLVIAISTERGLVVEGEADFAVEGLGEGKVHGAVSSSDGFGLEGTFRFDTELFDEAEVELWYRDDVLGARGTLVIGANTLRGVRSGRVQVEYTEGQFSAEGTVEPDVPGIEEGQMRVAYSEEEGLRIGGGFQLADDLPAIRSGSVDIEVRKGETGWTVVADGTARPDIPGVDTTLHVRYEDGLFTIEGEAQYARGMLEGQIELGVTNRPVDESGVPQGEPALTLRAYGGGRVSIQLAPWLRGTVGIRLLENGEVELSGSVGLPQSLELFEEKAYERTLLRTPSLDIPIIGVAAAGQRIGIFATIRGGLEARASIGPGELRDVDLGVTYNPDREDETRVEGGARLHVPAMAGLRLYVRGGVGAGIPVVSASAGLEVGGELGLDGALDAGVNVVWTPADGLGINTFGQIYVQPKFRFDVNAFVVVELDLLLDTVTLFEERWELAAFEYGSDLRFGLKFPVRYQEGEPFNISLSDVEFEAPEVDVKKLIGDLVKEIV